MGAIFSGILVFLKALPAIYSMIKATIASIQALELKYEESKNATAITEETTAQTASDRQKALGNTAIATEAASK